MFGFLTFGIIATKINIYKFVAQTIDKKYNIYEPKKVSFFREQKNVQVEKDGNKVRFASVPHLSPNPIKCDRPVTHDISSPNPVDQRLDDGAMHTQCAKM